MQEQGCTKSWYRKSALYTHGPALPVQASFTLLDRSLEHILGELCQRLIEDNFEYQLTDKHGATFQLDIRQLIAAAGIPSSQLKESDNILDLLMCFAVSMDLTK
jgi:hypothetical protein